MDEQSQQTLNQYRGMRDGLEAERDVEMAVVQALRDAADDHDRIVHGLNGQINQMWKVISELEQKFEVAQ